MKKLLVVLLVVAVAIGLLASAWPAHLTIHNRAGSPVHLYLNGTVDYYFHVDNLDTKLFEVKRGFYYAKLTVCGVKAAAVLDLTGNTKLTLPPCITWLNVADKWRQEPVSMLKFNPFLDYGAVHWVIVE